MTNSSFYIWSDYNLTIIYLTFLCTCCRCARFILDTCLWCWQNESDTETKICGSVQCANTRKCKYYYNTPDYHFYDWLLDSGSIICVTFEFLRRFSFFCWLNGQLLESFETSYPTLTFPPLPNRGDFELEEVIESPYFFNWSASSNGQFCPSSSQNALDCCWP